MFEPIELYAKRTGHQPLSRFSESSQVLHKALGIDNNAIEYDEVSGILRARLVVTPLHQGTKYGQNSIMYGIVISAFADMLTGAAGYLRAGKDQVVNHNETRIRYTGHVFIQTGTSLYSEIHIPEVRKRKRSYYCNMTIYQECEGSRKEVARAWARIPGMLEKLFERVLKTRS